MMISCGSHGDDDLTTLGGGWADGRRCAAGSPGPTPMDTAATEQNELRGEYRWEVTNFSRITERQHYSPVFLVGGHAWRLLMFPKGNNSEHLSLYLEVPVSEINPPLPFNWQRTARFDIRLISTVEGGDMHRDAAHTFYARESDWGFTQYCSFVDLRNPAKGLLVNDTLNVEVGVEIRIPEPFVPCVPAQPSSAHQRSFS
jgi:ubiquitin carboxyl-terminal hydrolase 7